MAPSAGHLCSEFPPSLEAGEHTANAQQQSVPSKTMLNETLLTLPKQCPAPAQPYHLLLGSSMVSLMDVSNLQVFAIILTNSGQN